MLQSCFISVNIHKIYFEDNNPSITAEVTQPIISYQRFVKYLGIHVDQKLTWNTHIKKNSKSHFNTMDVQKCRMRMGA